MITSNNSILKKTTKNFKLKFYYINYLQKYNNLHVSISKPNGSIIFWKTSKVLGYTNKLKNNFAAAYDIGSELGRCLLFNRLSYKSGCIFIIKVFGFRKNLKIFLKSLLKSCSINIKKIISVQPIPHNGCFVNKRKHKRKKLRLRPFFVTRYKLKLQKRHFFNKIKSYYFNNNNSVSKMFYSDKKNFNLKSSFVSPSSSVNLSNNKKGGYKKKKFFFSRLRINEKVIKKKFKK